MNIWYIYLLTAIVAAVPLFMIQKYINTNNYIFLLITALLYLILIILYIIILKDHEISVIYPLTKILSIIIVVVFGYLFFNNKLCTKQIIGIIIGVIGIYLLCS
ncbi:membrane protein [Cotonvirus japonicus]|uniref:Membrane protein n=1 Tax=Cotonvirus japonicus TaxID=2811091 RepID=A0ABM7NQZ8_9VIRU|nr:membrane protein [Cotonvirus japonicus]BCS82583.1 membrane protein [Cotonvirus japonicus]